MRVMFDMKFKMEKQEKEDNGTSNSEKSKGSLDWRFSLGQRIAEVKVLKKYGGMIRGGLERKMHKKPATTIIVGNNRVLEL